MREYHISVPLNDGRSAEVVEDLALRAANNLSFFADESRATQHEQFTFNVGGEPYSWRPRLCKILGFCMANENPVRVWYEISRGCSDTNV